MPLYEFRCLRCGRTFEEHKPMDQSAYSDCLECPALAKNVGVYHTYMKTNIKGPGAAWIRDDKESPTAVLKENYDPPVESREDMERMIKQKGVVPLG